MFSNIIFYHVCFCVSIQVLSFFTIFTKTVQHNINNNVHFTFTPPYLNLIKHTYIYIYMHLKLRCPLSWRWLPKKVCPCKTGFIEFCRYALALKSKLSRSLEHLSTLCTPSFVQWKVLVKLTSWLMIKSPPETKQYLFVTKLDRILHQSNRKFHVWRKTYKMYYWTVVFIIWIFG